MPLVTLFLTALPGAASAQYAGPSATPPAPPPVAEIADESDGILEDASIDRAWMSPTAINQPAGSWTINSYEIVGLGMTYAFSDSFQASLSTILPLIADDGDESFVMAAGKLRLMRSENLHLALHGSAITLTGEATVGTGGAVATYCLDRGCHSFLSGYAGLAFSTEAGNSGSPRLLAGSVVARLTKNIKFVGELDTAYLPDDPDVDGYLAWYGVRITGKRFGVDLGLVKPSDEIDIDEEFTYGYPWIAVTYRSL